MDAKARAEGPKLKRTLNDDVPNNWTCGDVDSGSARERMGKFLQPGVAQKAVGHSTWKIPGGGTAEHE